MNVHFEDWSGMPLAHEMLPTDQPHNGRVIKAYAADTDPRQLFEKPELRVIEVNDAPFAREEIYAYPERRDYHGLELEADLVSYDLSDFGQRIVRSLFRFANQHGFCQAAMRARRGEAWRIDHPFEDIHGIDHVSQGFTSEHNLHIDIFSSNSLRVLRQLIVDYDNPEQVLTASDIKRRITQIQRQRAI